MNRLQALFGLSFPVLATVAPQRAAEALDRARLQGWNLNDYLQFGDTPRDIDPSDFVSFLRMERRFKRLDLTKVPKYAVILHDAYPEERLARLGVVPSEYLAIETGDTDPNRLYFVTSKKLGVDFILNRGLPGAGGITTQAAELFALGVKYVTHIGTCGLFGRRVAGAAPIVSKACVSDGGGVMLSRRSSSRAVFPDAELSLAIKHRFHASGTRFFEAAGYTIPIYYYQPTGLVKELATSPVFSQKVEYVEMEGGALFPLAKLMGGKAASVVVGVDRYTVSAAGVGKHEFLDVDDAAVKETILRHVVAAYRTLASS